MTPLQKRVFLILYLLFIIYGSLFPLTEWRLPQQDVWAVWMRGWSGRVSSSDLLTNILVYIPFGFLLVLNLPEKSGLASKVALVTVLGTILSFTMEYLQMFLPARTSSLNDILLNTVGGCVGGAVCLWPGKEVRVGSKAACPTSTLVSCRKNH